MSSVQSATNPHTIPWQFLQSIGGVGSPTQQASGAQKDAAAFDPLAGLGETPPSAGSRAPTLPINIGTMSALIGAQEQSGLSHHQQKVFGKLDGDGDGKVTGAELNGAFGSRNHKFSDFVMDKLDKDGDGAISRDEFAAGTTRGGRRHIAGPPPAQQALEALMKAATGAKSQTTTGTDGSSTTTITYADGSKVSMTSAATANGDNAANTNSSANSQTNLLQQLIKMQAQLTQSAPASNSVATV